MKSLAAMAAFLLASATVHADALADLRASLAKLTARDTVHATITVETNSRGEGDRPEIGKATFAVEHGPQGLRVTYAPALITRAQQEAREREADPERSTPTRTGMRQIDPAELMESLDSATVIARLIESAMVVKEQRVNVGGRALRQLTMNIKPKLSKSDAKRIKTFEVTLIMNVDDDYVPVSAEMHQKVKAKFFLMTFETDTHDLWTLARTGDRLVALRHVEKSTGSGMGQKFEHSETMTITLQNGGI